MHAVAFHSSPSDARGDAWCSNITSQDIATLGSRVEAMELVVAHCNEVKALAFIATCSIFRSLFVGHHLFQKCNLQVSRISQNENYALGDGTLTSTGGIKAWVQTGIVTGSGQGYTARPVPGYSRVSRVATPSGMQCRKKYG